MVMNPSTCTESLLVTLGVAQRQTRRKACLWERETGLGKAEQGEEEHRRGCRAKYPEGCERGHKRQGRRVVGARVDL